MHPVKTFAWNDDAAMRAFVADASFAQVSIAHEGRVMAAHAPLTAGPDGSFDFHLARANVLTPLLDSAAVLATIVGEHGYISPDWYGTDNQVPTWNYRLVEIEGTARRLDDDALPDLLDRLSAAQEDQLAPKKPWTMAKMDAAAVKAMLRGIVGFRIAVSDLRGVEKLGQNKSPAERAGAIAGLRGRGDAAIADQMDKI